ncbi:MAG TPA: hypothetical protein VIM81_20540 [Gammaproteobacteria bacterium]
MRAPLLDIVRLSGNPVFVRFCRSRLRLRKSIFWYLLTLIVTTFVVALIYIIRTNSFTPPQVAARGLWIPVLIIQGLILMFKGTGAVSAGLIQDKIDQTLDYQRLTPMTPIRNLAGYLFGLPVLEYVMFALTLPHLVFVVVVGDIPLATVLSVYVAFFTCVLLYHTMGIAAGMVMRRWFLGYVVAILLVLFVNVILPLFISQFGLKFFQYLSVWPVIGQKVLPVVVSASGLAFLASQNPFFSMGNDVPFFNWALPPFLFALLLQGSLIATFATMVLRRWQVSSRHSLSKPYALGFLGAFVVVLIGNVWPMITGRYMPFALFGQTDIDELGPVIVIGLPLVYSLVTWVLCFVLFAIVIPTHHSYARGIRRAMKLGRSAARPWDDDAGSLAFLALYAAVALGGFWVMFHEISAAGFLDDFQPSSHGFWRLPLALGLGIFYTALTVQVLELKPTVLVILLVGLLPILVAIVLSASMEQLAALQAMIASISPLAFVLMSGLLPLDAVVPIEAEEQFSAMLTGVNSGLVFLLLQIAFLWARWEKQKRADYAASIARETELAQSGGPTNRRLRGSVS